MTRTTLGLIAVFALIAAACVTFGAYFSYVTLLNAHKGIIEARFGIAARRVADVAEQAASFGIALPAQQALTDILAREARIEPALLSMDLVDEHGTVLFSSAPGRAGGHAAADGGGRVVAQVRDDLGRSIGSVVVRYDPHILAAGAAALFDGLKTVSLATLGGAFVATVLIGLLLAAALRRAVRRAAEPAMWPAAAKSALASVAAAHQRAGASWSLRGRK
ncbi:hypothetical protein EZH22_09870 [Xanthobacter dioxanivorans]|uniref:Uncharacterized protein n=1 Tax=Xanthobacter dioxanivorans TaxID=2528964 RepID=A0A974SKT2_9HYPH|nr:hypothetical protein [Xanthobacter dioxanivorans]QRG08559.1 hypothetical protein EZH22_09870 [Xanthobacter dioxanivorans]